MTELIPALVAGNAVLLKPSELTPATGALVDELIDRAGFPKDLVQILQGGGELGAAIIDAGPAKVFFTGSVATGRRIAEACAQQTDSLRSRTRRQRSRCSFSPTPISTSHRAPQSGAVYKLRPGLPFGRANLRRATGC